MYVIVERKDYLGILITWFLHVFAGFLLGCFKGIVGGLVKREDLGLLTLETSFVLIIKKDSSRGFGLGWDKPKRSTKQTSSVMSGAKGSPIDMAEKDCKMTKTARPFGRPTYWYLLIHKPTQPSHRSGILDLPRWVSNCSGLFAKKHFSVAPLLY